MLTSAEEGGGGVGCVVRRGGGEVCESVCVCVSIVVCIPWRGMDVVAPTCAVGGIRAVVERGREGRGVVEQHGLILLHRASFVDDKLVRLNRI